MCLTFDGQMLIPVSPRDFSMHSGTCVQALCSCAGRATPSTPMMRHVRSEPRGAGHLVFTWDSSWSSSGGTKASQHHGYRRLDSGILGRRAQCRDTFLASVGGRGRSLDGDGDTWFSGEGTRRSAMTRNE
jgi:hypothetical protein